MCFLCAPYPVSPSLRLSLCSVVATRKTYPGMTNLELVQRIRERQPGRPRAVSQDIEKNSAEGVGFQA